MKLFRVSKNKIECILSFFSWFLLCTSSYHYTHFFHKDPKLVFKSCITPITFLITLSTTYIENICHLLMKTWTCAEPSEVGVLPLQYRTQFSHDSRNYTLLTILYTFLLHLKVVSAILNWDMPQREHSNGPLAPLEFLGFS